MDLWRQQRRNIRLGRLWLAGFVASFLFLGWLIDMWLWSPYPHWVTLGLGGWSLFHAGKAWFGGADSLMKLVGAIFPAADARGGVDRDGREILLVAPRMTRGEMAALSGAPISGMLTGTSREYRAIDRIRFQQLHNVVEEMSVAAGIPKPAVGILVDDDPNALAIGRGPGKSAVIVTTGLLDLLDRDELQGVAAHEIAHIRNLDVQLMSVVTGLLGLPGILAARLERYNAQIYDARLDDGYRLFAVLPVAILTPIIVRMVPVSLRLMALGLSRRRELLADATAAQFTRHPEALASALLKIAKQTAPTWSLKGTAAPACVIDPNGSPLNDRRGVWADWWATHPPMGDRIRALKAMAYARKS